MCSVLGLLVDPLLQTTSASSLELTLPLGTYPEFISKTAGPLVAITEGIPLISMKSKLVEKICQWKFIDLSKLLQNQDSQPEEPHHHRGAASITGVIT